ncbi:MAG: O-antigen ligase family protein, partial [Chloroflexi bacterium]|nr:O-antigen ligase family protein [Chloroflexota bacterium]
MASVVSVFGRIAERTAYRFGSLRIFIATFMLLTGGALLPALISAQKWFYLVGLALAVVFGFVLLLGRLELGIVCCLAAALIVETVFYGYWILYDVYIIGVSDAILLALCVVYLNQMVVDRKVLADDGKQTLLNVTDALFLVFAICLFGMALSAQYGPDEVNPAYSYPLYFGLRSGLAFALTWRVLAAASPRNVRVFILALLLIGAIISLAQSADIVLGTSFLHIRGIPDVYWVRVSEGKELVRSVFTARYFVPYANQTVRAGVFLVPFFPLALAFLFSSKEHPLFRGLCGLIAVSAALNVFLYMVRAVWLGGLVAGIVFLIFQRRRIPKMLLLGGILLAFVLGMSHIGVLQIDTVEPAKTIPGLLGSERIPLWTKTLQALPHFPLLFGEGLNNGYMYAKTLSQYSTYSYSWSVEYWFGEYGYPHNAYLHLLVGAGVPAFLALMGVLAYVYRKALSALSVRREDFRWEALVP